MNNFNCEKTWNLFAEGKTKGIFQLESNLGKSWAKKVEPKNVEELAALISLIRPGTLKAISDGKSMAQHYVDRKHGRDKVVYLHESLADILKSTYGVILYQEQAMLIAQKLAGFNLQEADDLRKAIGKKKADLMIKIKEKFISGCAKTKLVTEEIAQEIFSWIEKSSRYSFNKCLDPTTTVITKEGIRLIEELKTGDFVLAPDTENTDKFIEVIDIINNGEKELYEVEAEDGSKIRCTLDHKFLCEDGQMRPLYEILEQDLEIYVYNN